MVTKLSDSVVVTDSAPLISAKCREMLNDLQELTFVTTADSEEAKAIKEEYYVVTKVANQWKEFIIDSVKDTDESELLKEVKATLSSVELNDSLLEQHVAGNDPKALLTAILKDTRWTVGIVESGIYNKSFKTSLQFMSVLEAVFELQSAFNCDINFSYVIEENRVVRRQVSLFSRLGADEGKRFEVDKDVLSIERDVDSTQLATAIYPVQISEDDEGETVVTTIADLEWKKSAGDPVDKPKGQKFIGDPIALSNWGRKDSKGLLTHRIKLYEFNEEVTVAQMASMSWVNLGRYVNPKITYTANVVDLYELFGEEYAHEKVVIGDTVTVIDRYFSIPISTVERVIEIERDLIDSTNNVITLGDSQREYSSDRAANRESVDSAFDLANKAQKNSSVALESANGKSTNYYGTVAPKNPKENDLWFRPHPDNPTEQQMVQWDGTQWVVRADTSELTQVKDKVDLVEQEAEEALQSAEDAVQKAGQAVADAGFAKDQADGALSKAITAEGAANQAKTDAQSAVADANSAISDAKSALDAYNNLSYENRNLLIRADERIDVMVQTNGVPSSYPGSSMSMHDIDVSDSEKITFSKIRNIETVDHYFRFAWFNDVGLLISRKATLQDVFTEDTPSNAVKMRVSYPTKDKVKIEKGSVATLWSPAPEDVQVQITDINGELQSKVSQQTFDTLQGTVSNQGTLISQNTAELVQKANQSTVNTLTGRVSTAEASIVTNANAITQRATKTEVNTLSGTVSSLDSRLTTEAGKITALNSKTDGHTTQIGSLQSSFSGLNSTVATVKQDLDGLDIGGGNLLPNSGNFKDLKGWSGASVIETKDGFITQKITGTMSDINAIKIKPSTEYIVTAEIMTSIDTPITTSVPLHTYFYSNNSNNGGLESIKVISKETVAKAGVWTRIVLLAKTKADLTPNSFFKYHIYYPNAINATSPAWFKNGSFYEGNMDKSWSPSFEDFTTVIQFSSLEQTVNGIQGKVANKAEQSEVTQLAGQWSATVEKVDGHTGQISNLGNQINLRLTQAQVDASILSDKTVKDTRNDNQTPAWYYSNYPKQTVKEFKSKTVIGLTQASGTYALVETNVSWSDASAGNIEQTAKADDGVYQRRGNSTTWTAWAKVADTSNILTQINLSPEGVLIQGKKVQITGETYIQSAVIKTGHIESLLADKITAGTLNAANVNVINLNASRIVTGTLTGVSLSGNSIVGGSITGTAFYNSGADGNMSIANGRVRAKDFFVEAEGSLTSLTSYVVVRSNENHVFLQPADGYEVAVTKVRTAGGIGNYLPIRASHFRGGNTNATFESMNGYSVLRSSGDTQPVYLQGNEIRATKVSSAGAYVAVRASAFPTGSLEEYKTHIDKIGFSALEVISRSDIYEYNLKSELESGRVKKRIGLVIGQGYNTPSEVIDGDGVEQYAMNALAWQAIKELQSYNELHGRISSQQFQSQLNLESTVMSLQGQVDKLQQELQQLKAV